MPRPAATSYFYSFPSYEGKGVSRRFFVVTNFYSSPSHEGKGVHRCRPVPAGISIHFPHMRGKVSVMPGSQLKRDFYSSPSYEGKATSRPDQDAVSNFYSFPSYEGKGPNPWWIGHGNNFYSLIFPVMKTGVSVVPLPPFVL